MSAKQPDQNWFVQQNGVQYGPYTLAALVEATRKGVIKKGARVWHPSWSKWQFAGNVPALFEARPSDRAASAPKKPPAVELSKPRGAQTSHSAVRRRQPELVAEPRPVGRFDAEAAVGPVSPRRRGRIVFVLLTLALLCGAGWTLVQWDVIDPMSMFSSQSPSATAVVSSDDKIAKATKADQPVPGSLPDAVAELPAVVALERNHPAAFEKFSKRFIESLTVGATHEEMLTLARKELRKSVKGFLAKLPDDVISELTEVTLFYMRALRQMDAESCVALSDDSKGANLTNNLARDFPAIFARDMKTLDRVASSPVDDTIEIPGQQQVEAQLENVFAGLQAKPLQLPLLNKAKLVPAEFGPYCDLVIAFYAAALKLPKKDSVNLLRYLYGAAAAEADTKAPQQSSAKD